MHQRFCLAARIASILTASLLLACNAQAQQQQKIVIPRGESTIVLEPYAPGLIRVTLSLNKDQAIAAPGYGIVASPYQRARLPPIG